jgi:hypothetical protein
MEVQSRNSLCGIEENNENLRIHRSEVEPNISGIQSRSVTGRAIVLGVVIIIIIIIEPLRFINVSIVSILVTECNWDVE